MFVSGIVTAVAGFAQNFGGKKGADVQWAVVFSDSSILVGVGVRYVGVRPKLLIDCSLTGIILCGGGLGWLCCTIRNARQKTKVDLETTIASEYMTVLLMVESVSS